MKTNKQFGRCLSILLILFSFLITTILINSNCEARQVKVVIDVEVEEYIAKYSINYTGPYTISGNITCNFSGYGDDLSHVKVNLKALEEKDWGIAITPKSYLFESNGTRTFNVSFNLPSDEDNRTQNRITVRGGWSIYPCVRQEHCKGTVNLDSFTAIVHRRSSPRPSTSSSGPDDPIDEPRNLLEVEGIGILLLLFSIPVLIILLLIYRRKKIKEDRRIYKMIYEENLEKSKLKNKI
jgi:hypothetical protein